MRVDQTTESLTMTGKPIEKVGEENQSESASGGRIYPDHRKQELRDQLLSLSSKLDKFTQVNERFFKMVDTYEKRGLDSDELGANIYPSYSSAREALTEPTLIYRLSSLMDLLKQRLDFSKWGVFLVGENDAEIEKVVASSDLTGGEFPKDFEGEIKARWRADNIVRAITQKRRMVLPSKNGNLLIVPFKILGDKDGFWAVQFQKDVTIEMNSSADLLFGVDMVTTCIENSYLDKTVFHSPQEKPHLMEREKLLTVVELSRAVVHEMNNSLQIILGRTQIVKMKQNKSPEPTLNNGVWDAIEGNAQRICTTLKNFSDFVHRQSDGLADVKEVNLQHILESDLTLLKYLLKSNGIELNLEMDNDLPAVCGAPGELELAFLSLVRGISDCLPDGGSIRLKTAQEQDFLCLTVYYAGKKSEKNKYPDLIELENNVRFKLVSQILRKNHGDFLYEPGDVKDAVHTCGQFEEPAGEERRFVMRFSMA